MPEAAPATGTKFIDLRLIDETSGEPLHFTNKNFGAANETKSGYFFIWGATEPLHTTTTRQWTDGSSEGVLVTTDREDWSDISATEKAKYSLTSTKISAGGYGRRNTPYQTDDVFEDDAPTKYKKYVPKDQALAYGYNRFLYSGDDIVQ